MFRDVRTFFVLPISEEIRVNLSDANPLKKSLVDDAAAQESPLEIKDGELPWGNGLIRLSVKKADVGAFKEEAAGLIGLPIAKFNPDLQGILRFRPNPIDIRDETRIGIQVLIFKPMGDIKDVLRHVLFADEPRFIALAGDPADAEPFALAQRIIEHPHVLAEDFPIVDVNDLALGGGKIVMEKFAETPFADEANARRTML